MARDINDRLVRRPETPAQKSVLGTWQAGAFHFNSPEDEHAWHQQAYRHSVDPDRWQGQPPVDGQTQAMLDGMPGLGSGKFFRGPDGKHRRITMELREHKDIEAIRRHAFDDYARTGVTWKELGEYPDDKPHPGEEAAPALTQARRAVASDVQNAAGPNKTRNMGAQSVAARPDLTRVAGDIDLDLTGSATAWGIKPNEQVPPILMASSDKAVSGMPKNFLEPQPFLMPPKTSPSQRRQFNEGLVGRPANDNQRATTDGSASAITQGTAVRIDEQVSTKAIDLRPHSAGEAAQEAEWREADRLFNWSRKGYPEPAPRDYAVRVVSEEERFTYLEEMKDEWSRLLAKDPGKVLRSMISEVEKLSVAAQRDFFTAHHEAATATQIAEMEDAIAKTVFAPAAHWKADTPVKPNEIPADAKPYIALQQPVTLTGTQLADALTAASEEIANSHEGAQGGRPGSLSTRQAAETITKKLADAIRACGGEVSVELYGKKEPQIQRILHQVKDSRYPDGGVPFEIRGRMFGAFVSHYTPGADGAIMNRREAVQWDGLIENISRAIVRGELGIEAAGVGAVRKQAPNESDEEYLKMIDDLIKDMIDCKRPFLIKLDINPKKISPKLELLEDLKDTLEK